MLYLALRVILTLSYFIDINRLGLSNLGYDMLHSYVRTSVKGFESFFLFFIISDRGIPPFRQMPFKTADWSYDMGDKNPKKGMKKKKPVLPAASQTANTAEPVVMAKKKPL